jgi:hypothetical protein
MTGKHLFGPGKLFITLLVYLLTISYRVIVNYADYALQFFTSDGTFFIELSLGVS